MKKDLKNIIIQIRKKHNITQKELANELNVTYQAVSKWERGLNYPDIDTLRTISEKYNIDMNVLVGKKSKKRYYLLIILIPLMLLLIFNIDNNNYNFNNIISLNPDFKIDGVIAYSKNKTSIDISSIDYLKEDNNQFINLDVTLYEQKDDQIKRINKCDNDNCNFQNLNKSLEKIKINVGDFKRACSTFTHNNLYIEITGLTKDGEFLKYNIPLEMEDDC